MSDVSSLATAFDTDTFLTLFVTQLEYQDPLDPMDTSEMLSQLSDLCSVQSLTSIDEQFDSLISLEELSTAEDLIGLEVTYQNEDYEEVTGTATEATIEDGEVGVVVDDEFVSFDDIISVTTQSTEGSS